MDQPNDNPSDSSDDKDDNFTDYIGEFIEDEVDLRKRARSHTDDLQSETGISYDAHSFGENVSFATLGTLQRGKSFDSTVINDEIEKMESKSNLPPMGVMAGLETEKTDYKNPKALGGDDLYISNIDSLNEDTDNVSDTDTAHDYNDNMYDGTAINDLRLSHESKTQSQKSIHQKFLRFSTLFALNYGALISCMSLITARLGGKLTWLYLTTYYGSYALSALMGVTYVVKSMGEDGIGAVIAGMWINSVYICFALVMALARNDGHAGIEDTQGTTIFVIVAGLLGGLGGGLLWTAQGSYFADASAKYAKASDTKKNETPTTTVEKVSKELGGQFATIYLTGELVIRIISAFAESILDWSYVAIIVWLTSFAVLSASLMPTYVIHNSNKDVKKSMNISFMTEAASITILLFTDLKLKYIIPFCMLFPITSCFVTSVVNKEVVPFVFEENNTFRLTLLKSIATFIATLVSIPFARLAQRVGNGIILVVGCMALATTSLLFLVMPELDKWGVWRVILVYGLQGIGRATFQGNLRAEFAVMFANNKESAFGNIVLWGGIFSLIGHSLTFLQCSKISTYCIERRDGSLHNVFIYELFVLISSLLVVFGLVRLSAIMKSEENTARRLTKILNSRALDY